MAPLEMNAGTCWGKNTIGPRGRSVEKAPGSDFNFNLHNVPPATAFFDEFVIADVQIMVVSFSVFL
jgi:hypothetical protein